MIKYKLVITISLIALTTPALAAGQWYQDVYGTTNYNGQVTLTDSSGNSVATSSNPTGANVNPTQSSSVQPPVVIVQATASLPIKAVGDACTASTTGTAPNQSAGEGTAITADRTLLLSCQSGSWAKQAGVGSGAIMYLQGLGWPATSNPATCPAGWSQIDYRTVDNVSVDGTAVDVRTCYSATATRTPMYLGGMGWPGTAPAACPAGWTQADYKEIQRTVYGQYSRFTRTCY